MNSVGVIFCFGCGNPIVDSSVGSELIRLSYITTKNWLAEYLGLHRIGDETFGMRFVMQGVNLVDSGLRIT